MLFGVTRLSYRDRVKMNGIKRRISNVLASRKCRPVQARAQTQIQIMVERGGEKSMSQAKLRRMVIQHMLTGSQRTSHNCQTSSD